MRVDELSRFIVERQSIYNRRARGERKPWTKDVILRDYRFCNVFRELDTETRWIKLNWRDPNSDDADLWLSMLVARYVNWHPTLEAIGYPKRFDLYYMRRALRTINKLIDSGAKVWTGAYMVTTHKHAMQKPEYIFNVVLNGAYARRDIVRPRVGDSLHQFAARLATCPGVGPFMVGQVVADVKQAHGSVLHGASDWDTWCVMGMGSRRGMNRVLSLDHDTPMKEHDFRDHMDVLRPLVLKATGLHMDAQDLQNCLCEWDKYERTRLKQGRPRNRYNGTN